MIASLTLPFLFSLVFSLNAGAACIAGSSLVNNAHDEARTAIAQESVTYAAGTTSISLHFTPDYKDTQVYLVVYTPDGGFGAMVPDVWCYDTDKNEITFTQAPLYKPLFSDQALPLPAGSSVWTGYYSSQQFSSDCTFGYFLNYLPGGPNGTFGQEYVHYKPGMTEYVLSKKPKPGTQIYLYAYQMWVYGLDWCFDSSKNSVRFLKNNARHYAMGATPGALLGDGEILWFGYVPEAGR